MRSFVYVTMNWQEHNLKLLTMLFKSEHLEQAQIFKQLLLIEANHRYFPRGGIILLKGQATSMG